MLRLPVEKAIRLDSPVTFDRAVALFAAELRQAVGGLDVDAVRAAVAVLDADWRSTTAEQRGRLVSEALVTAGRATAMIPERIRAPLGDAADAIVAATRDHARRGQGLAIAADFNALDRRIITHIVNSQGNFVRDEYGRRVDSFGAKARQIVAEGLEQGLGRDDIAADLEQAARHSLIERSPVYWEVVAGSFVAEGRSFAQMSSYAEAGVTRYIIEAVLDERTTEICRYLHGKAFEVGDALQRFDRLERMEQPEDIKRELPWVREGRDPETGTKLLYVNRDGGRATVAEVARSGFGNRDDRGEFNRGLSTREMMDLGISFPPYHGLCRTTTLADVS